MKKEAKKTLIKLASMKKIFCILVVILSGISFSFTQETRIALVIGNSEYKFLFSNSTHLNRWQIVPYAQHDLIEKMNGLSGELGRKRKDETKLFQIFARAYSRKNNVNHFSDKALVIFRHSLITTSHILIIPNRTARRSKSSKPPPSAAAGTP